MTVTFDGRTFRVVLDTAGRIVVIVETGPRSSRVASPHMAEVVLAGFNTPPIRSAPT